MHLFGGADIFDSNIKNSVLTIGNFDGVHRGHQEIFRRLKQKGNECGMPTVVVTFDPHPLKVLATCSAPPQLTTFAQKSALIAETGIDALIAVPFSMEFSRMAAECFVHDVLCESLGMHHIIIGHDYAFGRNREGNFSTLARMGRQYGFTLEDVPPIGENGAIFSSSLARSCISTGDMDAASGILGRYYAIAGTVVHGRNIGAGIGFPTANIVPENELIPPDGVYAVMVSVGDMLIQGACNIGYNPTFGGNQRTVEVFLLDFSDRIYDHTVTVHFVKKLRPERRFTDIAALQAAISNDVADTRAVLDTINRQYLRPLQEIGTSCA